MKTATKVLMQAVNWPTPKREKVEYLVAYSLPVNGAVCTTTSLTRAFHSKRSADEFVSFCTRIGLAVCVEQQDRTP